MSFSARHFFLELKFKTNSLKEFNIGGIKWGGRLYSILNSISTANIGLDFTYRLLIRILIKVSEGFQDI